MEVCDRIHVLDQGRTLAEGSPAEIRGEPRRDVGLPRRERGRRGRRAPMLELDELDVRYGSVPAVRGLNLEVGEGELVGLIGPNGAGKSTTLHAIMGVVPAAAGDVRLAGQSLRGRAPETIARAGIALVPEGRRIFGELSVEENLRLGLAARRAQRRRDPLARGLRALPDARRLPRPPGRRALGRPAAAARDRPRARRRAGRAPARRAVARARADRRRHGLRGARRRSASAASRSCSSSSARSARSRSPTAPTCSPTASCG